MKNVLIICCWVLYFSSALCAGVDVSLEPVQSYNQEGHSVPLFLKVKNTGEVSENVPFYFVPYFDYDLKVYDEAGNIVERSSSIYDLASVKPMVDRSLIPGETYSQKINDLRELYRVDQAGYYSVRPVYYRDRNKKDVIEGKTLTVPVGNVAGDRGFLIFSDSAYIEKSFCFSGVYPDASYYLRDHSTNYYILGARSDWLQAGLGYSDGLYAGVKWQVWAEQGWRPAFAALFYQWNASREIITLDRDVRGYQTEDRATSFVFSKRLPYRSHVHLGVKRHDIMSWLELEGRREYVYPLTMIAVDQSYSWGMLIYERDHDTQQDILSEAFMYRGLPSWEPQIGLGLVHYDQAGQYDVTLMFFALYFYVDNFLLGMNF